MVEESGTLVSVQPSADVARAQTVKISLLIQALQLLVKTAAVLYVPAADDASSPGSGYLTAPGTGPDTTARLDDSIRTWLSRVEDTAGEGRVTVDQQDWRVAMVETRTTSGAPAGVIVMARPVEGTAEWSADELVTMRTLGDLCGASVSIGGGEATPPTQRRLDALVTRVAVELMSVSASELNSSLVWVLRELTEFFQVDTSFLRHNDFERDMTVLVAEWPPRENVPTPDPLGEVPFGADPIFDAIRDLKEPFVMRPTGSPDSYQERVEEASGVQQVSLAMVPLIRKPATVGVLGFIKFGDRPWDTRETNALQAIASLLVQLQARVDAEERLQFQAYHDHLTGLPNRRALLEEIERRPTRDSTQTLALIFLDIDRFKAVNDVVGHSGGDRYLVLLAERLRTAMRVGDFVARLAGDKLVFLLQSPAGEAQAVGVAEKLLKLVGVPVTIGGHQLSRTASVGISVSRADETLEHDPLEQADAALHRAKAQGGNQAVLFDEALRASTKQQSDTELQLRSAIDHEELMLYYQPEVDLRTGQLLAVEALVRWNHPQRGVLAAGSFITVAEETGLIVDLGRWVLVEACRQMAIWRHEYPGLRLVMRVNMSPAQLATRNIVRLVDDCLKNNNLPARVLCIEITEHAVMQDVEQALAVLHDLKALGVSLAIDDFGTGYSSMSQLKRLPVDALKVDQTFVAGLGVDGGDRAIVAATVRLAQAFGLEVIGEGVETPQLVDELLSLGCHRAQGFLLSRPKPAADLVAVLSEGGIDPSTFGQHRALASPLPLARPVRAST
jgi:diguanylate cyclase (GGDEF)-like protein